GLGVFFFFQAEDGIRDFHVTGVQTCALPISLPGDWQGREVVLGLRPEHLARAADAEADAVAARVELVEPVGSEVFVNLELAGRGLVARLPPGPLPEAGGPLRLRADGARAHLFDPASGRRLEP